MFDSVFVLCHKNTESRKIKSNQNLWIVMNYINDEYKLLN